MRIKTVPALLISASLILLSIMLLCGCANTDVKGTTWTFDKLEPSQQKQEAVPDGTQGESGILDVQGTIKLLEPFMEDMTIEFEDDGKVEVKFINDSYGGRYTETPDGVDVVMDGEEDYSSAGGHYKIEGDELVLTEPADNSRIHDLNVRFKKVHDR